MVYFAYEQEEKDYHDLEKSTCECSPTVRFLDSGDMLIVHNSLVQPDRYDEKQLEHFISNAICKISENKL